MKLLWQYCNTTLYYSTVMKNFNSFKKQCLLALALFTIGSSINCFAQIKVQSDGKIGIGTTTPSKPIELNGFSMKFNNIPPYNDWPVFLDFDYSTPKLYCNTDNKGYIGFNSKFW